MTDKDVGDEATWAWVATAYRATPERSAARSDPLLDALMDGVDAERSSGGDANPLGRASSRGDRDTSSTYIIPRAWSVMAAALAIVMFVMGLGVGRWTAGRTSNVRIPVQSANATSLSERSPQAPAPSLNSAPPSTSLRTIQFVLSAPHASHVTLVGDFNGWDTGATPMQLRVGTGLWTVSIPLPAGRHIYAFVVDGNEWVADPAAPRVAVDAFGAPNSVVIVGRSI